jgi:hypothetical protein
MGKFISSFESNGNKITLMLENNIYIIYWAKIGDEPQNRDPLIYPDGRRYKFKDAIKHFNEAAQACSHLTFSKT